jgi:hypothetical protein
MAIQIQLRRGDAADWTSSNPLLAEGELGIELDTLKIKIGNGIDNWNALAYVSGGGGGGGVTSVTGTSPIVSSGGTTPAISLASTYGDTLNPYGSKTANYVLASPDGSSGVPTFRAIVASDIPTLNQNTTGSAATLATGRTISITGDLAYTSPSFNGSTNVTASGTLATVNTNVGSFTNASLTVNAKGLITAASSGTAPVTSVTGTSPVTSSGGTTPAIGLASGYGDTQNPYASKTANFVLAAPNGSSGVPSFRAIVASDIPTLNQNTTGTAANITASSNSTLTTLSALSLPYSQLSGTVPTWNQNTTGTASNVTGTVAIANGGSGTTTAQGAMNAFAGAVTSGSYLRGNGTDVVMSAIQAADVPTLNQNTTGTASNVTGVVAVANGGTGTATPSLVAGTNITITGSFPNQTINSTASGSGTVTSVAATVPSFLSVSGSPITTSGTLAFTLASTPTNGQLLIGNGTGFSYSTLTAGSNITITNSSGGITIASTGGGGGSSSPIPKLQSWSIGAM